jgi:hypothetical protein
MREPSKFFDVLLRQRLRDWIARWTARPQRRRQGAGRIKIPHLARDLRRAPGRIETRDATNAAAARDERSPGVGHRVAAGRDRTNSGDDHAARRRGRVLHEKNQFDRDSRPSTCAEPRRVFSRNT